MTLPSPRYESGYRMHDALLDHPFLRESYDVLMVPYSPEYEDMQRLMVQGR